MLSFAKARCPVNQSKCGKNYSRRRAKRGERETEIGEEERQSRREGEAFKPVVIMGC